MKPVRAWGWLALHASLIFWLSSMSHPVPVVDDPLYLFLQRWRVDLAVHMLEYGLFGWLAARAFAASTPLRRTALLAAAMALGAAYGASDEWHQSFVPLRDTCWSDWIADCLGSLAGAFIWNRYFFKGATCRKSVDSAAGVTTPRS